MIGLGIDLCEVARIEAAMLKSDGFAKRYFTQEERAYLDTRGKAAYQSAAAMFAAKEAFLKALGVGLSGGVAMADIGVIHDALGCPGYALSDKAKEKLAQKGAGVAHVSLTHDAGVAAAVCILE
ncbi:MAG TPA: holo-ACP synthase [Candidatus Limiplasma sp.]|nr:holo-ACP synthase [Candidatus Limiplasma sp.]HPS82665.1 holo-ACP synthase [Candidatus Limiplasma sp.]